MDRRDFLRTLGAGATAAGLCRVEELLAGGGESAAGGDRPNIVLAMADDQGWGDMAYYGHPTIKTPCFDAMAAECLRFDRFYAAAPVCSPTRGSVMTGRHPNRFGCFKWGNTLRPQEITIAEALKTAGYATGHFGKWHLGPVRAGSPLNPGASGFDEWFSAPNFFDLDPILSREGKAVPTHGEGSMVTVDAAIEFIRKQAKAAKPFLAVVWFGNPHKPQKPAPEDLALYKGVRARNAPYQAEITGMDRAFGKLRAELRTLGIHKNTILWYCSDNGGIEPATTGGRAEKGSIYEGGLRVPGLLEWPDRIAKPRVTDVPAVTSDIYPTLLDLTGIRMKDQPPLDGISLVGLLDGQMKTRPGPVGFWDYAVAGKSTPTDTLMKKLLKAQEAGEKVDPNTFGADAGKVGRKYPLDSFPGHAAWLDWPWKLHRIQGKGRGQTTFELYNLADDPGEKKDLAAGQAGRVAAMKAALEAWLASVVRSLNGEDYH